MRPFTTTCEVSERHPYTVVVDKRIMQGLPVSLIWKLFCNKHDEFFSPTPTVSPMSQPVIVRVDADIILLKQGQIVPF
jgi:hypothetical protein